MIILQLRIKTKPYEILEESATTGNAFDSIAHAAKSAVESILSAGAVEDVALLEEHDTLAHCRTPEPRT